MGAGMKLRTISVIMPCLNEEKNIDLAIQATLNALDRYEILGELIVVNDGSTDQTGNKMNKWIKRNQRVRLLEHESPQGIGVSFWHGVQEAKNAFITMFPGDNENNPEETLTYFNLTENVDVVIPFIHNIEVRSKWRRLISSLYRFMINLSFGTNLNYTNGTVIYNNTLLKELRHHATGFFYQTEILVRLIRAGYLYAEVPHFLQSRSYGKTKALSLYSFWNVTKGYLRLMWDIHIVRKFGRADSRIHEDSATYRRRCKSIDSIYENIQT